MYKRSEQIGMRKKTIKIFPMFLAIIMIFGLMSGIVFRSSDVQAAEGRKMVILYTANLRGDVTKLAKISAVKKNYEQQENTVVKLVDLGNYLQGTKYSSYDLGLSFMKLMGAAGYDALGIGRYDVQFADGKTGNANHGDVSEYGSLGKHAKDNGISLISSNLSVAMKKAKDENGEEYEYDPYFEGSVKDVILTDGEFRVGVFALSSEEVVSASVLSGVTVNDPIETARSEVAQLKESSQVVIGLDNSHGADMLQEVDATVLESEGEEFEIGAVQINETTGEITDIEVESLDAVSEDEAVAAEVTALKELVDELYPTDVTSEVILNGNQTDVRSKETNLGDFWCDALRWYAISGEINLAYNDDYKEKYTSLQVQDENVVAVWNGGNLRNYLNEGSAIDTDFYRILPYPNNVAVVYMKGEQLLELMESSAQNIISEDSTDPGFFSVSGMKYTVDAYKAYDKGEEYKSSGNSYYKANSIQRVSIQEVNGNPLDMEAEYAVITNGGYRNKAMDSCYLIADDDKIDVEKSTVTTMAVRKAVLLYAEKKLNGRIGSEYESTDGRITINYTGPKQEDDGSKDGSSGDQEAVDKDTKNEDTKNEDTKNNTNNNNTSTNGTDNTVNNNSADNNAASNSGSNTGDNNADGEKPKTDICVLPSQNKVSDSAYIKALGRVKIKSAVSGTKRRVRLKWKKIGIASGYMIYQVKKSGKKTKYKKLATIKKGSQTAYVLKKLKSGKKYKFVMKAYIYNQNKKKLSSKNYSKAVTIKCK